RVPVALVRGALLRPGRPAGDRGLPDRRLAVRLGARADRPGIRASVDLAAGPRGGTRPGRSQARIRYTAAISTSAALRKHATREILGRLRGRRDRRPGIVLADRRA